jgi:hypothetical protein
MFEYQYIANREKPGNWLTTISILIIIALLAIFVYRSDQEHERREKEKEGLRETVSIQARSMVELAKECQGTSKEKGKRGS